MLRPIPALLLALAPAALAQQFQHQPGAIPGPARWTEGVEAADVDRDGDLDLFFADGEGFSAPGAKRQNVLVINQRVEQGPGVFTDESVARLGARESHAKGVATGDVDGDGWVDALFANAFNTDTPFLYVNRGEAQPGYFDMQSASRGLTEVLSSASAQMGDLDDDGDLDLIVCDSGASFLGGSGGRPRLYLNDGAGSFTEDAAALGAPLKKAHMDVQLVDVDGDFDLDFFGANRASNPGGNHYLMLNDGSASFTDASALLPAPSASCYEAEVGDLDGDSDLDLFFVSLSGFQEGHVENRLVPAGALDFVAGALQPGFVDDNEVVLVDHDGDGDLDPIVGSLGPRERIYVNQGGLVFTDTAGIIEALADSTLDATVADLDDDGDHDLVTAQGESNPGQWANKIYWNSGPADVLPPVFVALDAPAAAGAWPVVLRSKLRDSMIDDGIVHLRSRVVWAPVDPGPWEVRRVHGTFTPAVLAVPVGARVRFTNADGLPQSVTSATPPWSFDLALPPGGSVEYVFVSPGSYDYTSSGGGSGGTIVVTGEALESEATYSGGGQFRYCLGAPEGGAAEVAFELFASDRAGNTSVTESRVLGAPGCGFERYCQSSPSSVGAAALISCNGKLSVAENRFALSAGPVPQQFGIFFFSQGQTAGGAGVPFGNGLRCVGTAADPIVRLPATLAGPDGFLRQDVDLTAAPASVVAPGSTWNFQAWFRDPAGGGAAFNLSDAIEVRFCQ